MGHAYLRLAVAVENLGAHFPHDGCVSVFVFYIGYFLYSSYMYIATRQSLHSVYWYQCTYPVADGCTGLVHLFAIASGHCMLVLYSAPSASDILGSWHGYMHVPDL